MLCRWAFISKTIQLSIFAQTYQRLTMPPQTIYDLFLGGRTLTHEVADNPNERILKLAEKLFASVSLDTKQVKEYRTSEDYSKEDLDRAFQCGKFPYRPSDLFLMVPLTCAYDRCRPFINTSADI